MFNVGDEYTREEIQTQVGGGLEILLPNKAGVVVAACLTKDKNPRAPSVILCGVGEDIAAAGAMLARQGTAIPVFINRGTKRWQYIGNFRPSASHPSGPDFESRIAGSGRDRSDVSRVIVMTPAAKT